MFPTGTLTQSGRSVVFHFSGVQMLFLPRPRILKPHLSDPFAQPRNLRYSLEVLSVRVRVQLKVRLQHLQLLFRERGSHPFRLVLAMITFRISAL